MNEIPMFFRKIYLTFFGILVAAIAVGQLNAEFSVDNTSGCTPILLQFTDLSTGNPVSWSWTFGTTNSTAQNPSIAYTVGGTYTICLTVTDANGATDTECKTDFITIFDSPTPNFSNSVSSGCLPLNVPFTDLSMPGTGTINTWFWSFGDGQTSTLQNPSHTYLTAGTYDIILSVTDDNGCSNTISQSNVITVSPAPTASFTGTGTTSCNIPSTVSFTNTTTSSTGNPINYFWDFGDGTPLSTITNPNHIYNNFGNYDVTLIAEDAVTGCRDTTTMVDFVIMGSGLNFTYSPTVICGATAVAFTDNSGNTSNWFWDFGDGGTSTDKNPTHSFAAPGCYTVFFSATLNGCTSSISQDTCIRVSASPMPSYTINGSSIACDTPHTVSFSGIGTNIASWHWDFGDGNTTIGQNLTHTYTNFGDFPITLTVVSNDGCPASVQTDTVRIEPLVANFTSNTFEGCAPLAISFADSSASLFPITNWKWHFGNGDSAMTQNPTYTYSDTGSFDVTLIVTNTQGCHDTTTYQNFINVGMPPVINFTANPTMPCAGDSVFFMNNSSSFTGLWAWNFGDTETGVGGNPVYVYQDTGYFDVTLIGQFNGCFGQLTIDSLIHVPPGLANMGISRVCENPFDVQFVNTSVLSDSVYWDFGVLPSSLDTSSLDTIFFTYPQRGLYQVTLTAFNDSTMCDHTIVRDVYVTTPTADFTLNSTTGCAPFTVSVTNNSIDAIIYEWSAPGATISNPFDTFPTFTYDTAGTYTGIQLIVTDINGCKDTLRSTDIIRVAEVSPNFSINTTTGCAPLPVNFTDNSTTNFGTITGWTWDFGDSIGTSTQQNPSYTYPNAGSYDVTLVVTNSIGCSAVFIDSAAVLPTFPAPSYIVDTVACTGQTLVFNNTSTGTGLTYLWDFGDGNTSADENPMHSYGMEGTYTICLTATDANGCQDVVCNNNQITVVNPVANFGVDTTTTPCFALTVTFSDSSQNAVAWHWDFGNGTTADVQNPVITYTQQGSYDVCLIVTSASGCTDTLCRPSLINILSPSGTISLDTLNGCPPLDVSFIATGINVSSFIWVFDDGNILNVPGTGGHDTITTLHSYQNGGTYHPTLFIESVPGCTQVIGAPDSISVELFDVDFTMSDSLICEAGTINLGAMINSTLPIDTFFWSVSGGMLSSTTAMNPTVTYTTPGIYDITLWASDGTCDRSITKIMIVASNPQVNYSYTAGVLCHPQSVDFLDASTSAIGNIIDWSWTFASGVHSPNQDPTHIFATPDTFGVQLIVGTEHGCIDSTTQTLIIHPTPVADAGPDVVICRNEPTQLNGSGGDIYAWSNGSSLSCQSCPNPLATPTTATDYILTATSSVGCSDMDTVNVSFVPFQAPVVTISNDTTLCLGDTIQLFAGGSNDVLDYQWDARVAGLSCYTGCSNPFAFPTTTTTFYVTLTGEGGCTDVDSVTITILQSNPDIVGADQTICAGESIQLQSQTGVNHQWSPSAGLSCIFCADPVASPTENSEYIVTALNALGCPITDTITINVIDPTVYGAGADQVLCPGESVQLDATVTGIFSWNADSTLSDINVEDPIATPTTTTTYYLTIDIGSCMIMDSVTVFVTNTATVYVEDETICEGDSVELITQGLAQHFTWSPATGLSDPNSPNPIASPAQTTTYTVVGSVGTCDADSTTVTVTVVPAPIITGFPIQNVFQGETVELALDVEVNPTFTYNWSPNLNSINCLDCPTPIITADQDSVIYSVTASNIAGCVTQDSIQVLFVNDCSPDLVVVPNGFTPNGDGLNDVLYVRGSAFTNIVVFRVFARNGELVFSSNTKGVGWDGNHQGRMANTGVFVYYVEVVCPATGNIIQKRGNVTLMR